MSINMAAQLSVYPGNRLIHLDLSDCSGMSECAEAILRLSTDPGCSPDYGVRIDLRGLHCVPGLDEVRDIARILCRTLPGNRQVAFIVAGDVMPVMIQVLMLIVSKEDIRVRMFRSREEADGWLAVDGPPEVVLPPHRAP